MTAVGSFLRRIPGDPVGRIADGAFQARVLRETGVLHIDPPGTLARAGLTFARWGPSPATGITIASIRHPEAVYIEDELGTATFGEVHVRSNALARGLAAEGIGGGDGVAIMCRNHRGFVEATLAAAKLGAGALYLNTMFSAPQITDVMKREAPLALIYDEEFAGLLEGVEDGVRRFVSWREDGTVDDPAAEDLVSSFPRDNLKPPSESPRFVILTSGTTGTPRGAQRTSPKGLKPLTALFDKIPFRAGEPIMVAAPMFHSWGFTHFVVSLPLASRLVLRRRFDPEETLAATERSRADALAVVPVMMQRILELPEKTLERYPLESMRITSVSGSALPGELAVRWMDRFGEVVYNLYGSTEVAYATVATPEDLRAAPGTAGRPPYGTVVKIFDQEGNEVPRGETGRVFVGSEMAFEGYTGGGGKDTLEGLLSTGDVGHFDPEGRLFIDGRDDEMIVSGGENVFPREIEDLLADHEAISEAAVIGVSDEEFGQRLKAFVVPDDGAELDPEDVKAYVKQNTAAFKVPREVELMDVLPRNATGKVLKRDLG